MHIVKNISQKHPLNEWYGKPNMGRLDNQGMRFINILLNILKSLKSKTCNT
jgi:hypothetical protein